MPEGLLPLFPLEVVLLPRTPLPLHIFEERYKEMIGYCLEESREFGVVLARGNGVLRTGCTAAIDRVLEKFEDGRMNILAYGVDRFEIVSIDFSRDYFQAEVRYFDDDDDRPARPGAIRDAADRRSEYARLVNEEPAEVDLDDPQLSFMLAQISPDLNFRQMLLQLRSEADRIDRVAEHLSALIHKHRVREAMGKVARSNGHGKHLPETGE
jgi:Lon protease-like protein